MCGRGGIGRRSGFKIHRPYGYVGSSPTARTITLLRPSRASQTSGKGFALPGLVEIAPPGCGLAPERFALLRETASAVLPGCFEQLETELRWCCERPMTPSSRPSSRGREKSVTSMLVRGTAFSDGRLRLARAKTRGYAGLTCFPSFCVKCGSGKPPVDFNRKS